MMCSARLSTIEGVTLPGTIRGHHLVLIFVAGVAVGRCIVVSLYLAYVARYPSASLCRYQHHGLSSARTLAIVEVVAALPF